MEKQRLSLYGWTGLAYFAVWLLIDLVSQHLPFTATLINSIWLALYITVINFLFFERFKGRLWLYPLAIILLTVGLYAWRFWGIGFHLYTPLKSFTFATGVIYTAPHGLLSLIFFGLVKNQSDHKKLKKNLEELELKQRTVVNDHMVILVRKKKVKLFFADILYVESQREYVKIVIKDRSYLTKMSTQEIETALPAQQFRRVHRSFIVSLAHIDSYTAGQIQIAGRSIAVGRAYRGRMKKI